MLVIPLVIFLIVLLALRTRRLGGSGPIQRPCVDLLAGSAAGLALAAPLLLAFS